MENHHLRCSAAAPRETLADITPPQEDQENINPPAATAALQDEQLTLLREIVTMIHQTTTRDARRNHVVHRTLAQRMNEFHDADQQQLQQMTNTLGAIITEQQRMNEQLQARQQASRPVRFYRTPIRRRTLTTRHDLSGASVWAGDVLSRTWRDRCDTGTSGQRRSDGNIELVRFLDSHEGDGARAVFAGVQLLYKNNFPNDPPSKFAHR